MRHTSYHKGVAPVASCHELVFHSSPLAWCDYPTQASLFCTSARKMRVVARSDPEALGHRDALFFLKKHIAPKGVKEILCSRAGYHVIYFSALCSAQAARLKLKRHVRGTKNTQGPKARNADQRPNTEPPPQSTRPIKIYVIVFENHSGWTGLQVSE